MRSHLVWMLIGCVLPLLLVFAGPLIGIRSDVGLFLFIILMFVCHLLMAGHHRRGQRGEDETHADHPS